MGMLYGELLQYLGVGGVAGLGLSDGWYAHLLEENLAELLGRPDVEGVADVLVDALLQLRDTALQLLPHLFEGGGVDGHPDLLHLTENAGERELHVDAAKIGRAHV